MLLCGLGAVQSNFCIVAAKLQWSVGAIGYRCGCNWVCCYVGWGQQAPNMGKATTHHQLLDAQLGSVAVEGCGARNGDRDPKGPTPMATPNKGNHDVWVWWGSEGSKWQPWTYFTYFHPGWVWCGNQRMQLHKGHESQWV